MIQIEFTDGVIEVFKHSEGQSIYFGKYAPEEAKKVLKILFK